VATETTTISLSINNNPGGGALSCGSGTSIASSSGFVTFTGCSISTAGVGYTLLASASGASPVVSLTSAISPAFTVGAAAQLVFAAIPASATTGQIFPTNPVVAIEDGLGNVITTDSALITLSISSNPGGGGLTCTGGNSIQTVVVRQIALLRPTNLGNTKTISAGTSITFTTTVRPIGANVPQETAEFVLYRLVGHTWELQSTRTVAVDSSGRASWTWTANTAGSWYVRSEALPTTANANSGWSPVEEYRVS
jgi:hypothetical protein